MNDLQAGAPYSLASELARNWWVLLIRGALLILLGIYAVIWPGMALIAFCYVLGAFLAADGILAIVAGVAGWVTSRLWTVVRGVVVLLIGLGVMAWPALFGAVAGLTLVFFIAGGLLIGGVLEIAAAVKHRKSIKGEGWLILDGALSILFGVLLALMPLVSMEALIMVSGIFAIVFGCAAIVFAFQFRNLRSPTEAGQAGEAASPSPT